MQSAVTACQLLRAVSMDELTQIEVLDGSNAFYCNVCKCKCTARRCLRLTRLPRVLNLHLLRFVFDKTSLSKKKVGQVHVHCAALMYWNGCR